MRRPVRSTRRSRCRTPRRRAALGLFRASTSPTSPHTLLYRDHPISRDGKFVWHTTSGIYGHTVGTSIGMGYVNTPVEMPRAEVLDAPFELQVNGIRVTATASFRPFYDPASERTRL